MGAFCILNDEPLKIWKVKVIDKEYTGENGIICDINKKSFIVKCAEGSIEVLSVQAKGGKEMDTGSYMRGHCIEKGAVLK